MSALGDYYRAQAQEKIAGIPLQQAQAFNAQATGQGIQLQNSQIVQNAQSNRAEQAARAGLANTEAGSINAKLPGEIDATAANTALTRTRNALAPAESAAQIGSQTAQANLANTTAKIDFTKLPGLLDQQSSQNDLLRLQGQQTGQQVQQNGVLVQRPLGLAKGTSHVKAGATGKGKMASTDTVPAMLSPGEAVLNRGAAEHMGRGVIDHLNHHGLLRMAAQKEVAGHVAKLAKHAAPKGKPAPGSVMHFMTGGMVPQGVPGAAPGQGLDLASMVSAMAAMPGAGGPPGGPPGVAPGAPTAPPSGPSPRRMAARKGKR